MPGYIFDVTILPRIPYWRNPYQYAAVCGFSCNEEEEFTRFKGDVSPIEARHFADYLDDIGLQYICQAPTLVQIWRTNLMDLCLAKSNPMRSARPNPVYQMMQAKCVAGLLQCSFSDIIGRVCREPGLPMLSYLTEILRFMIEYEVAFADIKPHEVFCTPIKELGLSTRVVSLLTRIGFRWAELLLYVTAEDLGTIERVGPGSVAQLENALARRNMRLWRD